MYGGFWTDTLSSWITWIAACLSGFGGKMLFDWWMARQKASVDHHRARLEADVALMQVIDKRFRLIVEDADKTVARLRMELDEAQRRLDAQQKLFTAIWSYVDRLINALTAAGIKVPPRPSALSPDAARRE